MTNKYIVSYSPAARDDLFAIRRYIANQLKAPTTATKLAKRIRDSIKELDTSPERYVRVDWEPWHSMNMRHYSVGNYEIFYVVDNENAAVTIARIFYGGRDIENIIANETDLS